MSSISVTRHIEFEMAHLLDSYNGGCGNLHGHSYKLEVTVETDTPQEYGFVIDFKLLDTLIRDVVPDHKFVACAKNAQNPDKPEFGICGVLNKFGLSYEVYPFDTSAENMVAYFAEAINRQLHNMYPNQMLHVTVCKLWETTNSYATWCDSQIISVPTLSVKG